jgi:cytidine deaminase
MVKLLNQENAAYPSGLCAERVAIFMQVLSNSKILKMAITAAIPTKLLHLFRLWFCRQSIAEYEIKQETPIEIYFMSWKYL